MSRPTDWRGWALWPLNSRKVQTAVVALILAWAAEAGIVLDEGMTGWIVTIACTLIGGIAVEDGAKKLGAAISPPAAPADSQQPV